MNTQISNGIYTEDSPLMGGQSDSVDSIEEPLVVPQGSASVSQTMINLAKTCCGSGCLALPYAAKEGGLLLNIFGLLGIALWNSWAAKTLCDCLDLLLAKKTQHQTDSSPPPGTSTLGKVTYYALGTTGIFIMDALTILLLSGIIVSYQKAILTFLQDTPFQTGSNVLDALLIGILLAPLSVVPDMGYLNKTSAAGLFVLAFALLVILAYGFYDYERGESITLPWLPSKGLVGVSHWFGCTVFGFGIVPLTFNFRESMREPKKLSSTVTISLLLVAICYIGISLVGISLYPNVSSDILSELPRQGNLPIITRLAMVIVLMATAPLLVVPCAELIEGKVAQGRPSRHAKVIVRFTICLITVLISVSLPSFVKVLAFVGCFSVALVSFCIPPLLHLILQTSLETQVGMAWISDGVMLAWGITATTISTIYTYKTL